jgi:hypothetical protein
VGGDAEGVEELGEFSGEVQAVLISGEYEVVGGGLIAGLPGARSAGIWRVAVPALGLLVPGEPVAEGARTASSVGSRFKRTGHCAGGLFLPICAVPASPIGNRLICAFLLVAALRGRDTVKPEPYLGCAFLLVAGVTHCPIWIGCGFSAGTG